MVSGSGFKRLDGVGRRFIAALLLALALPVAAAEASPQACRRIEGQLASLGTSRGGSSAQLKRYDTAIARQQQQLQRAREQAHQLGCGRFLSGINSSCNSLKSTMGRMQSNLVELQRTRATMGSGNRGQRAKLLAALDANNCRAPRTPSREAAKPAPQRPAAPQTANAQSGVVRIGRQSGNFRTMCVRTCDGYYFPVSYSVPQSAFERDANACQAMCPGTNVELHYHRMPGQESEDMVSVATGLPYREMKNAFLYRKPGTSVPAGCGCEAATGTFQQAGAAGGFSVIAGDYEAGIVADEPAETAAIPLPADRPDPAEDPETLASRDGGLDADTLKRLATPIRRPAEGGGERHIRVVGPVFLPDPEEAIDLRAPDQPRAR